MTIDFAFFGCWGQPGHFLFAEGKARIHHPEQHRLLEAELDGSRLFLPYPEVVGHGHLTYLPALDLSVLSWWNRAFDDRGKVNSHLQVRGDMPATTMWRVFKFRFKELALYHNCPIIRIPI